MDKTNEAVEKVAQSTRDTYEKVVDHSVAMQERNVQFGRETIEGSIKELRHQAEANRAITEELVKRAQGQREAIKTVIEESFDTYWNLAFAPLSYYRNGLAAAGGANRR